MKIQNGSLVPAYPRGPGKEDIKRHTIIPVVVSCIFIISAKWTEWTGEISCDAFFRPSVSTQYLDANISKTVWVRDLVPITH